MGSRRLRSGPGPLLLLSTSVLIAACGAGAGSGHNDHPRQSTTPTQAAQPAQTNPPAAAAPAGRWRLTWSAGFNKPGALNKWLYYSGGTGFGLKQLQWYDPANASINTSGQLVITADRAGDGKTCWYGACQYTSARMETKNTFTQTYGAFEARIKFPAGTGLWPAFWIEGANVYQVGWPACGEIDVVEPNGKNPYLVQAYAHAPHFKHQAFLTVSEPITAGFHTYGVVWTPKGITWYFDGHAFSHASAYKHWPFDKPFFIIMNLAVGGGYAGRPGNSTAFPAQMMVDWVRVYRPASGR